MANTFIQLNDTPSDYIGHDGEFLRVKAGNTGISFAPADLNSLSDVDSAGAYLPETGQALCRDCVLRGCLEQHGFLQKQAQLMLALLRIVHLSWFLSLFYPFFSCFPYTG